MTARALIRRSPQQTSYAGVTAYFSSVGPVLALLFVLSLPCFLSAQEVFWHHDYAAARQAAHATGRPVLYSFSTVWCGYCRKLEATTFQDPRVRKLLREYFVAVKLDGDREAALVTELGIAAFPTLILSDAAGRIIFRHHGFLDSDQLVPVLEQQVKARTATSELAGRTNERLIGGGQTAAALLAQARADSDAGFELACLQRCLVLLHNHAQSPEAEAARALLQTFKSEPARLSLMQQQMHQLQAELSLARAEILLAQGAKAQAVAVLETTLQCLGDAPAAEAIQRRVQSLRTKTPAEAVPSPVTLPRP